jgi:hypothetical protein
LGTFGGGPLATGADLRSRDVGLGGLLAPNGRPLNKNPAGADSVVLEYVLVTDRKQGSPGSR